MGWLYRDEDTEFRSRLDIVKDELEFDCGNRSCKVVYGTEKGSTVYCACKYTNKELGQEVVVATVVLTHIDNSSTGYNFGTKIIDETAGPAQSEAPKKLIAMLSPTENEYALAWRKRCLENAIRSADRRRNGKYLRQLLEGSQIIVNDPAHTVVDIIDHNGKRTYKVLNKWARLTISYILNYGFTVMFIPEKRKESSV